MTEGIKKLDTLRYCECPSCGARNEPDKRNHFSAMSYGLVEDLAGKMFILFEFWCSRCGKRFNAKVKVESLARVKGGI